MRCLHFAKNNQNGFVAWATNRGHFDRNDYEDAVFRADRPEVQDVWVDETERAPGQYPQAASRYNGKRVVAEWLRSCLRCPDTL